MRLWNRGKTEDLGGAWSLEKPDRKPRVGEIIPKVKTGWAKRFGRFPGVPGYITENISEELIRLEDLVKIYDTGALKVLGLKRINLTIHRGEFVAIMGQSGSGKSTLMNNLGCLDRPSMGHYYLDGVDVAAMGPDELSLIRNRKIGFVFQSFRLLQDLTALENAALPLAFQGVPERVRLARARELLEAVGLAGREGHRPKALSGGQQQRVAIARALATGPRLLLADEPTAGLDPEAASGVLALFDRLHKSGHTLILITHDPKAAARAARRASICAGKLKEEPHDQTGQDQLLP